MTQPTRAAFRRLRLRGIGFALPAVLAVAAVLVVVSYKQGLLTPKESLYLQTDTASGLTRGMPVKLNGFLVGNVGPIELLPPSELSDQRVRVELRIIRSYLDHIPRTTIARLAQEGLVGQSVIELVPERYDARAIAAGEVLPFERTRSAADIARELEERILPVLQNTEVLTSGLADPEGPFQSALVNGNALAADMLETNRRLHAVLEQSERSLAVLGDSAGSSLDRTDRVLARLEADLPGLLESAGKTATQMEQASADLAGITDRSSRQLPAILDDAESAAHQGDQLVRDVRNIWPINRMGADRGPQALPVDSLDGLPTPEPDSP